MSVDRLSELPTVELEQSALSSPSVQSNLNYDEATVLNTIQSWSGIVQEQFLFGRDPQDLPDDVRKFLDEVVMPYADKITVIVHTLQRQMFEANIQSIKENASVLVCCTAKIQHVFEVKEYETITASVSRTSTSTKTILTKLKRWSEDPTLTKQERYFRSTALAQVSELYRKAYDDFHRTVLNRNRRQLRLLDSDLKVDEIDDLIAQGRLNTVFRDQLMSNTSLNLREVVEHIEERHHMIQKLERDVREIFELFQELSVLVDAQQESLDVIDVHVREAVHHVYKAETELEDAERYGKRVRTMKCCCVFLCLMILAVVIVPTVVVKET